jgi:hypothetical protein
MPEPPGDSVIALRESLGALADRGQLSLRALRKARHEQLSATAPHQVFVFGLRDVLSEELLAAARPTGWRYLLEIDETVVASAETLEQEDGSHVFAMVNEGPFVQGTVDALAVAERVAEELDRELDLRLLHVPALYLMSLFLQSSGDEPGEMLFIPIAPTPGNLEAGAVLRSEDFLSRIEELARAVPEMEPEDERGGA